MCAVNVKVRNVRGVEVDWNDPRNIYAGRGEKDLYKLGLGNPYPMKNGEDTRVWRERVCNLVKMDVTDALRTRKGDLWHKLCKLSIAYTQQGELTLWCWCAPLRCHAEEYVRGIQVLEDELDAWCHESLEMGAALSWA